MKKKGFIYIIEKLLIIKSYRVKLLDIAFLLAFECISKVHWCEKYQIDIFLALLNDFDVLM